MGLAPTQLWVSVSLRFRIAFCGTCIDTHWTDGMRCLSSSVWTSSPSLPLPTLPSLAMCVRARILCTARRDAAHMPIRYPRLFVSIRRDSSRLSLACRSYGLVSRLASSYAS
ncbi:hypothetical protein LZ30DRAFT_696362 [Colletotrichum cereale]|nr:hypothetical protein LZ30DRAFT_696362 [Colletotrichum cereale]